jgi:hypothetical protein
VLAKWPYGVLQTSISGTLKRMNNSSQRREPPPKVDIEREMNKYVREFGGKLVSEIHTDKSQLPKNADYFFPDDGIVAELKCPSDDKTDDKAQIGKIQDLYDSFVRSGAIPHPGYGRFAVQSKNLPSELQNGIYEILATSIKKRLGDANRQIKETNAAFFSQ